MKRTAGYKQKLPLHTILTPGMGSKGQNSIFSKNGHAAYKIKGNGAYINAQASICPYTQTRPLG